VKRRPPFRTETMRLLSAAVRFFLLIFWLWLIYCSAVWARSWSYHYVPMSPKPSPEAGAATPTPPVSEQYSTAVFLKRAIISDLAVYVRDTNLGTYAPSADHSQYVVSRLLPFDQMNSPEALSILASLSGYYLGRRGEKLYDCLSLRKGKKIEPYLAQYLRNGNSECAQELGPSFVNPSAALDGNALCPSNRKQAERLARLISEIDSGESCSDNDLTTIRTASGAPAANKQ